jgi:MoxR-like ATPase
MAVVTEAIGIHGWAHLDAVLLAALASEAPLLLIGPHGTAKSLLIERISKVLAMEMRHYNSSLLNYDDLVGIPLPEEDGSRLRFVTTPGAIWDAEFVFFDEISRCRPDLQNKMFPIIHERKVIGMPLTRLRHRWAAMNPPAPDEPNLSAPLTQTYFGSEPLDPALCDRFPFIIPVPNWSDLSKAERKRLVSTHALPPAPLPPARRELADDATIATSAQVEEITMPMLVAQTAELIDPIGAEYGAWLSDYIVTVMDLLSSAQLPQSPRRAAMLMRGIISIHAARMVLEGNEADIERSTEMALLYGLPQTATDVPPTAATVISAHRQAWEICSRSETRPICPS